jgi:site-specific DNA-cytosine methylase
VVWFGIAEEICHLLTPKHCSLVFLDFSFDSVLYPDIVKLCDDPPRDVYGQEKPLPKFNIFVAGTSCKNFSMMMSNKRLDIEDKGCSGETFLAACELLMKDKPKFAVFENVTKGECYV